MERDSNTLNLEVFRDVHSGPSKPERLGSSCSLKNLQNMNDSFRKRKGEGSTHQCKHLTLPLNETE